MFIKKFTHPNTVFRTYTFPYKIGEVEPAGTLGRFWQPCSSAKLSAGYVDQPDLFRTVSKIHLLGDIIRKAGYNIERIDMCPRYNDSMDIKLISEDESEEYWETIEAVLSNTFCLEIR